MRKLSRKLLNNENWRTYSLWTFNVNYGEDCMKTLCKTLREHATNVINFEKKEYVTINKK